jgi:hypothetical protein
MRRQKKSTALQTTPKRSEDGRLRDFLGAVADCDDNVELEDRNRFVAVDIMKANREKIYKIEF